MAMLILSSHSRVDEIKFQDMLTNLRIRVEKKNIYHHHPTMLGQLHVIFQTGKGYMEFYYV